MPLRRSALAHTIPTGAGPQRDGWPLRLPHQLRAQAQRWTRATYRRWLALLYNLPVGTRLALGFMLAGVAALLASGVIGLISLQAVSQEGAFQSQSIAANAELTNALAVLQAYSSKFHMTLEDAAHNQPYMILLDDQNTLQSLATQYENELAMFLHEQLLAQHPQQVQWLITLGEGDAVVQQRVLVTSTITAWQRYHTAQMPVLQDILADEVSAAETLTYSQVNALEANTVAALYSLIQFENRLTLSGQSSAISQQIDEQRAITIFAASMALLVILFFGVLSIRSVTGPLNQLRRVMQAAVSGDGDIRADVVGSDSIAAVSASMNDLLLIIDRLLAEMSRQYGALVERGERLFSLAGGDDSSLLRKHLAEVGDPIIVLDDFCRDMSDHIFRSVPELHNLAQQLDNFSQRIYLRVEENDALANKVPLVPIKKQELAQGLTQIAQEIATIARQLEGAPGKFLH